jgi:uncharacterized protein (TIGR03790 family)
MRRVSRRSILCTLLLPVLLLLATLPAHALGPDEIALIVNSNEPAGRELAQFYAQARHIPDDRILELSLPKSEEMPFKQYEEEVVPQVREYLRTGRIEQQIKCFVTFFGVPIRIAARVPSGQEAQELTDLRKALVQAGAKTVAPVQTLEKIASEMDTTFRPGIGNDFDHLAERAELAQKAVNARLAAMTDPTLRAQATARWFEAVEPLAGEVARIRRAAVDAALHPAPQPATQRQTLEQMAQEFQRTMEEAGQFQQQRFDPKSREQLRLLSLQHFGLFNWVRVLREQADYLEPKDSMAAFDSELALVRWTVYPRTRWCENPFHYSLIGRPVSATACMVMRLDAPKAEQVRQIITDSLRAEGEGLKGKVVLDSRGMSLERQKPSERGLAEYDESIRSLGKLIREKTSLELLADDKPEVLPANSAQDVALYCGWYSLRQYIPACKFNPGAVGFHIASYEMISLHGQNETGWAAGLLNNGVASTIGPVSEPYVQTFSKPEDFFALLLTGRLTLVEAYWRTTPAASWMLCAIGDPLYTPYKNHPALAVEDLPDRLKPAVLSPATQPISADR